MMKKRAKEKFQLAPRTSSIAIASVVIYGFGAFFLLFGGFLLASAFTPSGVFMGIKFTNFSPLERPLYGLAFSILFGVPTLWAAHDLRRMEKTAAMLAILECLVFIFYSTAFLDITLDDPFGRYFFQPIYLNFIWLWPLPIAVMIIIWRNWGKMQWRAEMRMFFEKKAKQEKEGSEEL